MTSQTLLIYHNRAPSSVSATYHRTLARTIGRCRDHRILSLAYLIQKIDLNCISRHLINNNMQTSVKYSNFIENFFTDCHHMQKGCVTKVLRFSAYNYHYLTFF